MIHQIAISINEPYATSPYQLPAISFKIKGQEKSPKNPTKTPQTYQTTLSNFLSSEWKTHFSLGSMNVHFQMMYSSPRFFSS